MALHVAINFPINHYGVSRLVYVIALMMISASYVVGTHNRKKYLNGEFNRFQPKKYHTHHHYDSHMKRPHLNDVQPSFTINAMEEDIQGYGEMDRPGAINHPPIIQGNIM